MGASTEFYTTHHMFLDAEPLNIIVLDISKDLKAVLQRPKSLAEGIPTTQEEFLYYWLKTLESKARKQQIPTQVTVVLTHNDLIPSDRKKQFTEEFKSSRVQYWKQ